MASDTDIQKSWENGNYRYRQIGFAVRLPRNDGWNFTIITPFMLMRYGVAGAFFKQLNNYSGRTTAFGEELFTALASQKGVEPALSIDAPTTLLLTIRDEALAGEELVGGLLPQSIGRLVHVVCEKHDTAWRRFADGLRRF